ncbi:hypothetical protein GGI42DRAFT_261733 [Trichoderma sp. SZMC 28013]
MKMMGMPAAALFGCIFLIRRSNLQLISVHLPCSCTAACECEYQQYLQSTCTCTGGFEGSTETQPTPCRPACVSSGCENSNLHCSSHCMKGECLRLKCFALRFHSIRLQQGVQCFLPWHQAINAMYGVSTE